MSDGTHYTQEQMIAAYAIACPYCGAAGGYQCRSLHGLPGIIPHRGHMKAAKNAQHKRDEKQEQAA